MLVRLKERARALERETYSVYLAARDPRTPWYARVTVGLVLAYLASPIDLIPDFVPVLGYLDDLVLVPAGIALALRMIPADVMVRARQQAAERLDGDEPTSRVGAALVVLIWVAAAALVFWWVADLIRD